MRMKKRETRAKSQASERKKDVEAKNEVTEKRRTLNVKALNVKGAASGLKKGFGKLNGKFKGLMQSKEQKFNEEAAKHSNLIFNELSRFVMHFCNMALPFDLANELLIYFCNIYQMEKSKMHILLTELQSNQKFSAKMFSEREMITWSLLKRGNRLHKFGFSDKTLVIGLTIRFIDSETTLKNLCCLSKDMNEILREEVLKQSLMRANIEEVEKKRKEVWLQILKVDRQFISSEFEVYYQQ